MSFLKFSLQRLKSSLPNRNRISALLNNSVKSSQLGCFMQTQIRFLRKEVLRKDKQSLLAKEVCETKQPKYKGRTNLATPETLIYTNLKVKKYYFMSAFGIIQLAFWYDLSSMIKIAMAKVKHTRPYEELYWFEKLNHKLTSKQSQAFSTLVCLGTGFMIAMMGILYPARAVRSLSLLDGWKTVNVKTYAPFGTVRDFNVPLNHVSTFYARHASEHQVSLKIHKKSMNFMLDASGVYHAPEVFDKVVGLERKFV